MNKLHLTGNRSFFLLWSGNALSSAGFHGARIAYPLLILATTDSLAAAGWVGFALGAPNLIFQIPSGIVADRFERLRILMVCQVVGLLAVCVVATSVLAEVRHLALLVIAAAFVEGTIYVFAAVSELGAISDVVSQEQRPAAFAFLEAEQPIALLLGRAAGGAVFGLARWLPFVVDAVTYLYCLIALALIRPNRTRRDPVATAPRPRSHDLGVGIRVVWQEPLLRASTSILVLQRHSGE
ncbi:MFS transporter [Nocardia beijingensis]|uniref:MFS transporter n=1 Tax=Nocardia beijingensis TaxID=95162 RepID=UPI001895CE4E|nr:MFS transporter [Nocardia beijingensis]MBF6467328.1 MFS transporter [Nocardia beijingensis]